MVNDGLNALAMITINKSLVQSIDNFDDKVVETFISMKDHRIDFSLKKLI